MQQPLRIYVDTSVVGGCFDARFALDSRALFDMARAGRAVLLISPLVLAELAGAPAQVQQILAGLPTEATEQLVDSPAVEQLRDAYLAAGVVAPGSREDAWRVAFATVAAADALVSWNGRHIVHLLRIQGYNSVNQQQGYPPLAIHTPTQVI